MNVKDRDELIKNFLAVLDDEICYSEDRTERDVAKDIMEKFKLFINYHETVRGDNR